MLKHIKNLDKEALLQHVNKHYKESKINTTILNYLNYFIPKSCRLIDIGCGCGFYSGMMMNNDERKIVGVDLNDYVAHSLLGKNFNFEVASAYKLPFRDSTFDCVLLIDVFEHLYDLDRFSNEITRILKEDGIIIFGTPNRNRIANLFRKYFLTLKFPRFMGIDGYSEEMWHVYEYDEVEIRKYVEAKGFDVLNIEYLHFGLTWPRDIGLAVCPKIVKKYCHYYLVRAVLRDKAHKANKKDCEQLD